MKTLVLGILLFASLLEPTNSEAFIFIRGTKFNKGARPISNAPIWTNRIVRFYVNTNQNTYGGAVPADVSAADFLQASQMAIDAWNSACRSDIRVEFIGTTSTQANSSDKKNVILWDNRATGAGNTFNDITILAAATSVLFADEYLDCDIVVNGDATGTFGVNGGMVGLYDLVSILVHEVGHCLGLDHPIEPGGGATNYDTTNTVLYDSSMVQTAVYGTGDVRRRDINQDDKDGVDCVYERGRPLKTGTRCFTYHGTNGGAALTGMFNGGPTAELPTTCGSQGDARTARSDFKSGMGCLQEAVASDGESSSPTYFFSSIWMWIFALVGGRFVLRRYF